MVMPAQNFLSFLDSANTMRQQDINNEQENRRMTFAETQARGRGEADAAQQEKEWVLNSATILRDLAPSPNDFNRAADFFANHPIAQKHGLKREDITPESVNWLLAQAGMTAGKPVPGVEDPANGAIQSTFIGQDGNVYVVPKQGGTPRNTNVQAQKFAPRAMSTDAGVMNFNPNTQNLTPTAITPAVLAEGAATKAAAVEAAKTQAKATTQAQIDLPRAIANAKSALSTINQLTVAPGLKYMTGAYSLVPIVPNTPQAKADALAQQIQGKTFLEAYQTLRGGGQITEVEGAKAEAAIARLSRKQSTKDYQDALAELADVIKAGVARAEAQAKQSTSTAPTEGIKFLGFEGQ